MHGDKLCPVRKALHMLFMDVKSPIQVFGPGLVYLGNCQLSLANWSYFIKIAL